MARQKRVSLTTFVDFVSKAGLPKITVVKEFKNGDPYHPAFDFYKTVREAIVDVHENGKSKGVLDEVLVGLDSKKVTQYTDIIKGHKKFIGRRTIGWFDPPKGVWSDGGIDVQVNPELGLEMDGSRHVVKLYFKPEPLRKKSVPVIIRLMEKSLATTGSMTFAVLDVRRAGLHAAASPVPGLDGFLHGEAVSFASILGAM